MSVAAIVEVAMRRANQRDAAASAGLQQGTSISAGT
jgi:hypothetical protein